MKGVIKREPPSGNCAPSYATAQRSILGYVHYLTSYAPLTHLISSHLEKKKKKFMLNSVVAPAGVPLIQLKISLGPN